MSSCPLDEGAAFFALRSGVPLVPVAINGTSWLAFGRRIRVRVGEPIADRGRPTREAVAELRRDGLDRPPRPRGGLPGPGPAGPGACGTG